jgi:pimeloyl-ACP methyl ester carboxylesterase
MTEPTSEPTDALEQLAQAMLAVVDLAEQIAALVPGARLQVIDGAAHLVNVEQTEAFNAMVDQHLLTQAQLHPGRR